ncbi:hypothetical protein SUDANB66_00032 [Streptomyces sp. SudanB66_2053]
MLPRVAAPCPPPCRPEPYRRRTPPRRQVLPADAMVFRWASRRSSLPTPGCSVFHDVPRGYVGVLLADAGVFRTRTPARTRTTRSPCRRGGVPAQHEAVLSADAGMCRTTTASSTAQRCPPCRCGGVPIVPDGTWDAVESSPPMRGCSVDGPVEVLSSSVLPADAGVHRRPSSRWTAFTGPSRRCGGVPTACSMRNLSQASSPPTRGCSALHQAVVGDGAVLPADAGVFRLWSLTGASGPLRRRGGVPLRSARTGARRRVVLPADAGCSAEGPPPGARPGVLPAEAARGWRFSAMLTTVGFLVPTTVRDGSGFYDVGPGPLRGGAGRYLVVDAPAAWRPAVLRVGTDPAVHHSGPPVPGLVTL